MTDTRVWWPTAIVVWAVPLAIDLVEESRPSTTRSRRPERDRGTTRTSDAGNATGVALGLGGNIRAS
jgi:hypothetical protein